MELEPFMVTYASHLKMLLRKFTYKYDYYLEQLCCEQEFFFWFFLSTKYFQNIFFLFSCEFFLHTFSFFSFGEIEIFLGFQGLPLPLACFVSGMLVHHQCFITSDHTIEKIFSFSQHNGPISSGKFQNGRFFDQEKEAEGPIVLRSLKIQVPPREYYAQSRDLDLLEKQFRGRWGVGLPSKPP